MDNNIQPGQKLGSWIHKKTLGSGGFGKVLLWQNEESHEFIALKHLRFTPEESIKQSTYDRWIQEIKIMHLLNHDNVVRALEIPASLQNIVTSPLLAMEYCSGGDLRRVLTHPVNYCGLNEYELRSVCHDVMAAVEYLHSKHVIHRDIKPENIVIQHVDDKLVYKLIDLGYAKELNDSSMAQSLVGTYEYLAPELITQKYSKTVDYWCFGTVVFEIITGFRPFLPHFIPYHWHENIRKKNNNDIYVYQDEQKQIVYSQLIPSPHHLSRTMKVYMEKFLRLMLLWDPRQRGGPVDQENRRPACFKMLDDILDSKIIQVLCMTTNQILSYPVKDRHSVDEIQVALEKETKIPKCEQELIYALGQAPDVTKPATQFWVEPTVEWPVHVYLFKQHDEEFTSSISSEIQPPEPSSIVRKMINNPQDAVHNCKKCWGEAVFYCRTNNESYLRLAQGRKAAMLNLLRINSSFSKKKEKLSHYLKSFLAKREFFETSLNHDMKKYMDQFDTGIRSEKMYERWLKMNGDIKSMLSLSGEVEQIDGKCIEMQTKIIELQKSPFARCKPVDTLMEISSEIERLCLELKNKHGIHEISQFDPSNDLHKFIKDGNVKMNQLVLRSQNTWEKLVKDLYINLDKILNYKFQLLQIIPRVEALIDLINKAIVELEKFQNKRQDDIWKLVKVACSDRSKKLVNADTSTSTTTARCSSTTSTGTSIGDSEPGGDLSFFDRSMEESMMVITENNETRTRLNEFCGSLTDAHMESLTNTDAAWDFEMTSET